MRTGATMGRLPRRLARRVRIAVVRAEFNAQITRSLERACLGALRSAGIAEGRVERFSVPGCFELPLMAQRLALRKRYDAVIVLGGTVDCEDSARQGRPRREHSAGGRSACALAVSPWHPPRPQRSASTSSVVAAVAARATQRSSRVRSVHARMRARSSSVT